MLAALINFGFDFPTLSFALAAFAPGFALLGAAWFERRMRRKSVASPQEEKLLRPAGYSLTLKLDSLSEKILERGFAAMLCCGFSTMSIDALAKAKAIGASAPVTFVAAGTVVITLGPGIAFSLMCYRHMLDARATRLGLRGEQATAEALHEAADAGYRAFHDLQPADTWNIDHIAVGQRGVFVIETKARSRSKTNSGRPNHEVIYDGKALDFPGKERCSFNPDPKPIAQAERNARWLCDYLSKKTGEPVEVDPIVALPGWFVKYTGKGAVKVMNCKYLTKYLRNETEKIPPAQVRRIITALEEKNRTLEF